MIQILPIDADTFEVAVSAQIPSVHRVTVTDAIHRKYTSGRLTKIELLERSFEFLLARESNTSILREFRIEIIEMYFSEFRNWIATHTVK